MINIMFNSIKKIYLNIYLFIYHLSDCDNNNKTFVVTIVMIMK